MEKIPFIPAEEELDQLIASYGRKTATVLQFLKETGARVRAVFKAKMDRCGFLAQSD